MEQIPESKELNRRSFDGLDVRLMWVVGSLATYVAVSDSKTGDVFDVPVPDGVAPHEVYNHPFAYRLDSGS